MPRRKKSTLEAERRKQPAGGTRRRSALASLGDRALADGELSDLLKEAGELLARKLDIEISGIFELLPGGELLLRSGQGWPAGAVGRSLIGPADGWGRRLSLLQEGPLSIEELASESRFPRSPLLEEQSVVSGLEVLIPGHEQPFGLLASYSRRRRTFLPQEIEFQEEVANMLAQAIDRSRLQEGLRQRADELARSERRKDEFLGMLSHELRNPLDSISLTLEVMRIYSLPESAREEMRSVLERQVRRMTRLVDDLLDVSRVTSGRIELKKSPVDLSALVTHALEGAQRRIEDRRHQLSVSLAPEAVWLDADATRVEQALQNLLDNAARFTEPGGSIDVLAGREGEEAVVRIKDSGVGIPPEVLPDIFDLFAQEDRSLDHSVGGLGIGLTLVRKLVELHGGKVEAHSEGRGRGSEFVVRLPALPREQVAPGAGEPRQEEKGRAAEPGTARRVLVVDDNVDAAMMLATILSKWGHGVHIVHDGPAAMEVVRSYRPDVILLDIGLPGLDGYEIARLVRQDAPQSPPILVAMTGYGRPEDRRRSREAGFDYHLTKPVDLDALQGLLSRGR